MNSKLRATVIISLCLFQFFPVPYLFGEDEPKRGEQPQGENANAVEEKYSEEERIVKEMVKRLKEEKKELENLKILFDKISQKEQQSKKPAGKTQTVVKEEPKSIADENAPKDQIFSLSDHREAKVTNRDDQKIDGEENEREKMIIKDKDKLVQPFEIAENLYKMKEYQLSLDIYTLVNGEESEENGSWIKYQIANCYRNLKQFDKAMEMYKEVNREFEGSYWAKQSQWYIQDIEWRKEIHEKMKVAAEK